MGNQTDLENPRGRKRSGIPPINMTAALLLVAAGGICAGILTGGGAGRLWLGTTLVV